MNTTKTYTIPDTNISMDVRLEDDTDFSTKPTNHYNLDAIIAVGYSRQGLYFGF
jgi:hypothetical protein